MNINNLAVKGERMPMDTKEYYKNCLGLGMITTALILFPTSLLIFKGPLSIATFVLSILLGITSIPILDTFSRDERAPKREILAMLR